MLLIGVCPGFADVSDVKTAAHVGSDVTLNEDGLVLLARKDYRGAEERFMRAIAANPLNKYYYNNMAVAYMNLKNYESAYRYLQTAISMDSAYVKALSNMAIVCFHRFRLREAYDYYRRAKRLDEAYVNNRFDRDLVTRTIEQKKRENPGNPEYDKMLEVLRDR